MFTIAVKQYGEEGKNTENENENKNKHENKNENKTENKNEIKSRNEKEENMKEKSEIAKNLNISEDKKKGDSNIIMSDIIKNTEKSEILSQKDNTIKIKVTEKVNEIDSHLIPELKFGR